MAMTRKLWSLNGLGIKLGKDRRTVGRIMDKVRPDGKLQGNPAWYLTTALQALYDDETPNFPRRNSGMVLEHFADRLDAWRELHGGDQPGMTFSIGEMAELTGEEPETLLQWLRAGLPYVVEGDWESGTGFAFKPAWVLDWVMALSCLAKLTGDRNNAAKLRLSR